MLSWEGNTSDNPTCQNNCIDARRDANRGWGLNPTNGYWVCSGCGKPSPANLRECEICEQVYLPESAFLLVLTTPGRLELSHAECDESINYAVRY